MTTTPDIKPLDECVRDSVEAGVKTSPISIAITKGMRITVANTPTPANTTPMTPGSPAAVRISAAGPTLSHRVNPPQIQIAAAMP